VSRNPLAAEAEADGVPFETRFAERQTASSYLNSLEAVGRTERGQGRAGEALYFIRLRALVDQ